VSDLIAAWLLGLVSLWALAGAAPGLEIERFFANVPVIVVVWVALRRDAVAAFATVLLLGGVAGLMGGAARGVWLVALLVPALVTLWFKHRLLLEGLLAAAGWAAIMSTVFDVAFVTLVAGFEGLSSPWPWLAKVTPGAALATGVLALPLMLVLRGLGTWLAGRRAAGNALQWS
jgi:hypothetical protein